ncbi:response regulator [Candidatus Nitrosocosmicus hydrocola]|uniref:response regulator n=1 Tax=Candidatus Nitrosocosmicus hydrocola TaxID=1826872 RepID=UPI000AB28E57|nr:response regulator [Candidatus Nitrosocosmicus hydrocola]
MNQPNFESPIYYNNMMRKNESQSIKSNATIIDPTQITFINCTHKYCICFVDIIDSTKSTNDMIRSDMIQGYYSIFLNTMSNIIRTHNGRVIKNSGDGLLYYFPRTVNPDNEAAFQDVLECGLSMIDVNNSLNSNLNSQGLSPVSYRISANYGKVELAFSLNSHNVDLFGPPVNVCSKINRFATSKQMIIHRDLLQVIKEIPAFKEYNFRVIDCIDEYDRNNSKPLYQTYSVHRIEDSNEKTAIELNKKKKLLEDQRLQENLPNSAFNILLIDDDEDILFAFNSIISSEGYNVTTFSSSSRALSHFSDKNPYFYHLVIMDIRMPELNGIKLYAQLKILNPDVKVIFLSALNALDEVLSIFPEIKYSEIVRKPIEPETLLLNIKSILRKLK